MKKGLILKTLFDRLARICGYYTSEDMRMCVESAEREAIKKAEVSSDEQGVKGVEAVNHESVQSLPPGYIGYFASYSYLMPGRASGFGCIGIGLSQTIRSFSDVQAMTQLIESTIASRDGVKPKVVVLNWRQYEAPLNPGGGRESAPIEDFQDGVVLRLVA